MRWNPFKREPKPDQPLAVSTFDKQQGAIYGIRRGMWVVLKGPSGKRAIVTALSSEGMARIMIVHPVSGENEIELDVPASSLRQALFLEIPEARRPHRDTARALGYVTEKRK